ncbi:TetR/AcrR family transcriptional regulator [Marinifilum sp. JC070]|uniref:TetR/AcrR family transcriptional regulator n=2 Tax=Marinifilum caeruleilacunae TaxID=2499076 RepID=A0ABX1WSH4_9BACT|nr:TetR/AcrR family transcriptional regulator [Marinifilum caeruleilacunae]
MILTNWLKKINMREKSEETQKQILDAAKKIFAAKGLAGARMQEIADEAGINKALLHYYYRNKEKLFEQVFEGAIRKLLGPLASFLADDSELFTKIRNLCHHYYNVLIEYPFIPIFVLSEASANPDRFLRLMKFEGVVEAKEKTRMQIQQYINEGKIRPIDPRELLWNIMSLCIFPIVSRPIAVEILYSNDDVSEVLKQRADRVADFVIQSIKM